MKTLKPLYLPGGQHNMVDIAVQVQLVSGDELYLCNGYEDVRDAVDTEEVFEAQQVIGMKAKDILIRSSQVALVTPT